jgi:hypothetical protein
MHEEREFNIAALLGCIVGAVAGYHAGTISSGVLGSFLGFGVGAICIVVIGELAFALESVTHRGAKMLAWISPLIVLGVLLALAHLTWR